MSGRSFFPAIAGWLIGAATVASINLAVLSGPAIVPCDSDADCAAKNPGVNGYGVAQNVAQPSASGCWSERHDDWTERICGPAYLMPADGFDYIPDTYNV